MDEERLRELLRSPLDDRPARSAPRQVLVGVAVIAGLAVIIGAGAWLLGSDEESPAATVAAPPDSPTASQPEAPVGEGGTVAPPETTSTVTTAAPVAGYPNVAGLAAMAPAGPGRALMFGGGLVQAASGIVGRGFPEQQLWSLDLEANRWVELEAEPPVPAGRTGATLSPYGDGGEMMLFGGSADALFFCSPVPLCSADLLNDTWVLDSAAGTWSEVPGGVAPEPRVGHAAAYDDESGVVVVFGGARHVADRSGNALGDTWAWNVETRLWQQMAPPESPPARSFHAMAYHPELDLVVLWGGDAAGEANDSRVWGYDYDDDEWRVLSVDQEPPQAPWYHQMAYVPELQEIIVVGGWITVVRDLGGGITATNVGPTDDVWALEPEFASFRRLTPTPEPTSQVGLAVVPGQGVAVQAGGHTYLYDPQVDEWADLTEALGGI